MDAFSLIALVLLVAGSLAAVLYPLLQRDGRLARNGAGSLSYGGDTVEELGARYAATLANLKDLEFDNEMGKISAEDYQVMRTRITREAAAILHQLEQLNVTPAESDALDDEIEALLAGLKSGRRTAPAAWAADVEAEIAALKQAVPAAAEGKLVCPQCSHPVQASDAFCSACGTALAQRCPACGERVQHDDRFCAHCGQTLLAEQATG